MASKLSLDTARKVCSDLVRTKDRSAYVLSKYVPASLQDSILGLRAFNIETAKVVDGATEPMVAKIRLGFWKNAVQNPASVAGEEPVTTLLAAAQPKIHNRYLLTMLQTRDTQLGRAPLRSIEDMERFGEGVYSQILYATLDVLQTESPGPAKYLAEHPELDEMVSNCLAHIGQATGISALLRGFAFYVKKHNYLNLPVSVLATHHIQEQAVLDGEIPADQLKDAVFEVATRANDHIMTARKLLRDLADATGGVPTSVVATAMNAVPVQLYLERLEQNDFDLGKPVSEWKLPWRSWRAYSKRMI